MTRIGVDLFTRIFAAQSVASFYLFMLIFRVKRKTNLVFAFSVSGKSPMLLPLSVGSAFATFAGNCESIN